MNILITGNLGYIGSILVRFIKSIYPSSKIIGYDIGYFKDDITIAETNTTELVDFQYYGDIRNFDENILSNIDFIIHLAGISNDPIGNVYEKVTTDVNFLSSVKLAKMAHSKGVKSFVFASSCSVYGNGSDKARTENCQLNPLTAYAKSKVNTEIELKNIADENFTVTCLRFATACGNSSRLRLDLVLNDFIASAIVNERIHILSDGTPWRPLIDVEDMSRAITWAMNRNSEDSGNYLVVNVGKNENNFQIKELAYAVKEFFPNIEVTINPEAQPDNRSYKVDFSLFNSLANNYTPEKSIQQTINEIKNKLLKIKFDNKYFRKSNLIRLEKLNSLKAQKILNDNLEWIK